MKTVTPYEQSVYDATCKIPAGKVSTYKSITEYLQQGISRSAGQALKKNPFAPEVPCHRVIRSDRSLGGFYGHTEGPEITRKRALLESEGVRFTAKGTVEPQCLFDFKSLKR